MFKLSAQDLQRKSLRFRYAYFLITSFKFRSFRRWREEGEPNPFVAKTYRRVATERVEFTDIFEEVLRKKKSEMRHRI